MKKLLLLMALMALPACGTVTNVAQNSMVMSENVQVVELAGLPDSEQLIKLEEALSQIQENDGKATIVKTKAIKNSMLTAIKNTLIRNGYNSSEINIRTSNNPSEFAVIVTNYYLHQNQVPKSYFDQEWFSGQQVRSEYGSATKYNLARQMVDKKELSEPKEYDGPNAISATGAIEAYQSGQVRELLEVDPSEVGGSN